MSASATMEVATTTVLTLMEVMFAPALVATSLTVMDTHVMVGTSNSTTGIQAVVKYIIMYSKEESVYPFLPNDFILHMTL